MISNVARPLTAATRPDIWANTQMPIDADDHHPGQRHPEPGADHGVGDDVADVEEPADGGQDAQGDREQPLHRSPTSARVASTALCTSGQFGPRPARFAGADRASSLSCTVIKSR